MAQISVDGESDAVESWLCSLCTFKNSGLLPHCEMCDTPRQVPLRQQEQGGISHAQPQGAAAAFISQLAQKVGSPQFATVVPSIPSSSRSSASSLSGPSAPSPFGPSAPSSFDSSGPSLFGPSGPSLSSPSAPALWSRFNPRSVQDPEQLSLMSPMPRLIPPAERSSVHEANDDAGGLDMSLESMRQQSLQARRLVARRDAAIVSDDIVARLARVRNRRASWGGERSGSSSTGIRRRSFAQMHSKHSSIAERSESSESSGSEQVVWNKSSAPLRRSDQSENKKPRMAKGILKEPAHSKWQKTSNHSKKRAKKATQQAPRRLAEQVNWSPRSLAIAASPSNQVLQHNNQSIPSLKRNEPLANDVLSRRHRRGDSGAGDAGDRRKGSRNEQYPWSKDRGSGVVSWTRQPKHGRRELIKARSVSEASLEPVRALESEEIKTKTADMSQSSQPECVVCLDAPPSCVFDPCGHLACCCGCAASLTSRAGGGVCPICRLPVVKAIKLFKV